MNYVEIYQSLQASAQRTLQLLKEKIIPEAEAMLADESQKAEALPSSPEWQKMTLKEQLQATRVAKMLVKNAESNLFKAKRAHARLKKTVEEHYS